MASDDRTTLRELRRTRQRRRLGEIEWFDVAYRAYLIGFGGLIAVVVVSDALDGLIGDDVTADQWVARAPAVLGVIVAAALALGLRSGAEGGPVAIEVADVRHVLLAPIDRRMVMARPILQRLRSVVFGAAVAGAVLAQLVARELDEPRGGWAAAGALFGAMAGAVFVASAVIAHALRLSRWLATLIGVITAGWQSAAAWAGWTGSDAALPRVGPADLAGSVALWGVRQRAIDTVPIALTLTMTLAALALGGRLRIEPLVRRGELVSQLRFAATTQDLRTVVLLRRQLRAEALRAAPWGRAASGVGRPAPGRSRPFGPGAPGGPDASAATVWRRGFASLRRLPAPRLARMLALAAAAGVAGSLTVSSSPLFGIGLLAALFLLGLEAIEPLAQEIDRPNLTERLPVDRGWLFANHLVAPATLLAAIAAVGVAAVAVVEPAHVPAAATLAIPLALAGATGPVVAAVRDAPAPITSRATNVRGAPRDTDRPFLPPEFAGASNAFNTVMPIAMTAVATAPVYAMRAAGEPGTAARAVVGVALFIALTLVWIRRRDTWSERIRSFVAEGQAAR